MNIVEEPAYLIWSNMTDILIINVIGVLICLYALHIELSKEKDPSYRALCDINEHMSCSRVLTSSYSQGFGFMHIFLGKNHLLNSRNCNVGLVVYIIHIGIYFFLPVDLGITILYYSAIVGVLGSFYLAFILFVILKDVCLVCIATYIVNACLLYLTYNKHTLYHS